mmetsp:Transcript_47347/g.143999  ORF Transcript_47347/g.143999 Transcript_47347/m.143999 type:complete len:276 (+) Transcript_47347:384-1211(+)
MAAVVVAQPLVDTACGSAEPEVQDEGEVGGEGHAHDATLRDLRPVPIRSEQHERAHRTGGRAHYAHERQDPHDVVDPSPLVGLSERQLRLCDCDETLGLRLRKIEVLGQVLPRQLRDLRVRGLDFREQAARLHCQPAHLLEIGSDALQHRRLHISDGLLQDGGGPLAHHRRLCLCEILCLRPQSDEGLRDPLLHQLQQLGLEVPVAWQRLLQRHLQIAQELAGELEVLRRSLGLRPARARRALSREDARQEIVVRGVGLLVVAAVAVEALADFSD